MNTKIIFVSLALIFILLVGIPAALAKGHYIPDNTTLTATEAIPGNISSCTNISSPGEYILDKEIANNSASTCIYINSSDVTLDGANHTIGGEAELNTTGVQVSNPAKILRNITIRNLKMEDWDHGIVYNSIANGSIYYTTAISVSDGISINSSSNISLTNNTASSSTIGIALEASGNSTLTGNIVTFNKYGIILSDSNSSSITNNFIYYNSYGGLGSINSSNNTIYNNRFNNANNSVFTGTIYSNRWNITMREGINIIGGTKLGGNYWAHPNSTGFSQTCTDADNDTICDSPYVLDSSNVDLLPLKEQARTGRFRVVYIPIKNLSYNEFQQLIKTSQIFDILADTSNMIFILPFDIPVVFTECSEENALYTPEYKQIIMCYELTGYFERLFASEAKTKKELQGDVLKTMIFTFYHEMGHALIDVLNLPTTGREEDAVDQLATLILVRSGMEGGDIALTAAEAFNLSSNQSDTKNLPFWDEHSLDKQRFYNILCWVYGEDSKNNSYLVSGGYLPEERAVGCESEYEKLSRSWGVLLSPHLKVKFQDIPVNETANVTISARNQLH